jgi:hypothetical protein
VEIRPASKGALQGSLTGPQISFLLSGVHGAKFLDFSHHTRMSACHPLETFRVASANS